MISKSYPPDISNKTWQKSKGLLVKTTVKTSLDEMLIKCEKKFPNDFNKGLIGLRGIEKKYADAKSAIGDKEILKDLDTLKKEGMGLSADLLAYRESLEAALKAAKDTAKNFKASKTIPAAATKAAENIVKGLEDELDIVNKVPNVTRIGFKAIDLHRQAFGTTREMPPPPNNLKELNKLMNDKFWGAAFLKKAKQQQQMELIGFLSAMSRMQLNQKTYDEFIAPKAPNEINIPGSLRKPFVEINNTEEKDWSAAPWSKVIDAQISLFNGEIYLRMEAADNL